MLLVLPVHFGLIGIASAFITQAACACDGTQLSAGESVSRIPTHAQPKISDHNEASSEVSHCNAVKRNLIWNGDLERGTTGAPQAWSPTSWGKLNAKFLYPVVGYRGDRAVEVVVTHRHSGDAEWRFTHISASNDRVYGFSDEYSSDVITNVTVEYQLSSGAYEYEWLGDAEPTKGTWKVFASQITIPKEAVSLTVLHDLDKNGFLKVGNVHLTAMTDDSFSTGMLTLVFDDGRASQFRNARPIINAAGLNATYAIITKPQLVRDSSTKAFMTWAEITTLSNEKNEIAAHSRSHPDLSSLTRDELQKEVKGSYQDLVTRGLIPSTFVYPYGGVNSLVERIVRTTGFRGARGSYFGLDGASADRFNLHDIVINRDTPTTKIEKWIEQAFTQKRWVIFELHDVLPQGGDEYSITPEKLERIVNYIRHSGIKVVTLQEGLTNLKAENARAASAW
jgi:peptidoglycan/xylan/chitin deacetylase (PgdA/CDA1 family)